jgi:uncharacterized delta-60 repeat protein
VLTSLPSTIGESAHALALQQDGRIVAAGNAYLPDGSKVFALARYLPDGNLDPTFGEGGTLTVDFPTSSADVALSLGLRPDGRIVAAGSLSGIPGPDTTPPVIIVPADITVEATGPDGAVVSYTVIAIDETDPSPTLTCNPPSGSTFPIVTTVVTCMVTDSSGNSSQASFNVTVHDTTPPAVACQPADNLWHANNISLPCTSSDGGSGLSDPADANFSLSTSVPDGDETANASTNSHTVCDNAGNCTTAGPYTGIKIDRKPPQINFSWPIGPGTTTNPDKIYVWKSVAVRFGVTDSGSDVAQWTLSRYATGSYNSTCRNSSSNGWRLDQTFHGTSSGAAITDTETLKLGACYYWALTATDHAGNTPPPIKSEVIQTPKIA